MIELEELRQQALEKPGVSEDFPFDQDTLVFKVLGKIFMLTNLEAYPSSINLKCEPTRALELRERYDSVKPGYHMNKKHWNTITLDGTLEDELLRSLVDHSYDCVVKGLKRSERDTLATLSASPASA